MSAKSSPDDDKDDDAKEAEIPPIPKRPLTAYNLFSIMERHYILQQHQKPPSSPPPDAQHDPYYSTRPARYKHVRLPQDWYIVGKNRKPRRQHENHGLISFKSLSKMISAAWASAPEETRAYCKRISMDELDKYRAEQKAFKATYGEEAFEAQTRKRKNAEIAAELAARGVQKKSKRELLQEATESEEGTEAAGAAAAADHSSEDKSSTSTTNAPDKIQTAGLASLYPSYHNPTLEAMIQRRELLYHDTLGITPPMIRNDLPSILANQSAALPSSSMIATQEDRIRTIIQEQTNLRLLQAAQDDHIRLMMAMESSNAAAAAAAQPQPLSYDNASQFQSILDNPLSFSRREFDEVALHNERLGRFLKAQDQSSNAAAAAQPSYNNDLPSTRDTIHEEQRIRSILDNPPLFPRRDLSEVALQNERLGQILKAQDEIRARRAQIRGILGPIRNYNISESVGYNALLDGQRGINRTIVPEDSTKSTNLDSLLARENHIRSMLLGVPSLEQTRYQSQLLSHLLPPLGMPSNTSSTLPNTTFGQPLGMTELNRATTLDGLYTFPSLGMTQLRATSEPVPVLERPFHARKETAEPPKKHCDTETNASKKTPSPIDSLNNDSPAESERSRQISLGDRSSANIPSQKKDDTV